MYQSHQDTNTIVIHGKSPCAKPKSTKTPDPKIISTGPSMSKIEKKIELGEMSVPKKVPKIFSEFLREYRNNSKKTQVDVAKICNVPTKDIADMENGTMDLNPVNKIKIRSVQRILKLQKFEM